MTLTKVKVTVWQFIPKSLLKIVCFRLIERKRIQIGWNWPILLSTTSSYRHCHQQHHITCTVPSHAKPKETLTGFVVVINDWPITEIWPHLKYCHRGNCGRTNSWSMLKFSLVYQIDHRDNNFTSPLSALDFGHTLRLDSEWCAYRMDSLADPSAGQQQKQLIQAITAAWSWM